MAFGIGLGPYPGLYSAQRPTGRVEKKIWPFLKPQIRGDKKTSLNFFLLTHKNFGGSGDDPPLFHATLTYMSQKKLIHPPIDTLAIVTKNCLGQLIWEKTWVLEPSDRAGSKTHLFSG